MKNTLPVSLGIGDISFTKPIIKVITATTPTLKIVRKEKEEIKLLWKKSPTSGLSSEL